METYLFTNVHIGLLFGLPFGLLFVLLFRLLFINSNLFLVTSIRERFQFCKDVIEDVYLYLIETPDITNVVRDHRKLPALLKYHINICLTG